MYETLRDVWAELTAPGGLFAVTEIEVRGTMVKSYADAPPSLREIWLSSAAHADNDYLVYENERLTYAEAHDKVDAVASWLAANGVGPGDRVAIVMRNYPEWLLAYWAVVAMGATVVGMNAWWVTAELEYAIADSRPAVVIADEERLTRLAPIRSELAGTVVVGVRCTGSEADDIVPWSELVASAGSLPDVVVDPESDACVFYTSGTTGRPKGAQLTHRGCVANLMSLGFWNVAQSLAAQRSGQDRADRPRERRQPSSLVTTPLFHVTANNCVAHGMTAAGGKLVHMHKWEAGRALELIEREGVTTITGVPVMARELINHPDFTKWDTSTLEAVGGGGAPLQPDLVGKIESVVDSARPSTGYGMTETCGIITANGADFYVAKPDSVGPAMPVFDTKCVDTAGNEVGPGEVGELWVKGAQVIKGYLNQPEATAETIVDGWLRTGDIARIDDDGFIFIVDRAKDMVLRGGENVYCAEVEAAMFEHPGVAECAVFGVPDDRLGEEVGAAVVATTDARLDPDGLRTHLGERIARHKIPRYIWFSAEPLPRNASGKFLKRELRESLDPADAG